MIKKSFAATISYPPEYRQRCADVLEEVLQRTSAYSRWQKFDPGADQDIFSRFALFPSLTKSFMTSCEYSDFIAQNHERDLDASLQRGEVEIVHTSGSTADSIANLWYQPWWDASECASWKLNTHTALLSLGDHREAILTSPLCTGFVCEEGYLTYEQRLKGRFLYLNERSNYLTWTENHMKRMVQELERFCTQVLEAAPSYLARLSRFIVKEKIPVSMPDIIIVSYENPTLLQYAHMKAAFDCPIVSSYGSTEAGYVFIECEAGRLHQNVEYCHVDYVPFSPQYGGPHIGRILVTTFNNPWRTLFRFDIGDIVTLSATQCPCGRSLGLTIDSVEGRANNLLIANKCPVRFSDIDRSLSGIAGISNYQVIQRGESSYEMRIVSERTIDTDIRAEALSRMKHHLGQDAVCVAHRVDDIATDPPGKFCATKRLLPYDTDLFLDEQYSPVSMCLEP
ncbi:MAG: hypothetical protein JW795_14675 [Chitinivibrionales bacterium]|nr:hypothetical protein [Chitinivibrionales bacterium]